MVYLSHVFLQAEDRCSERFANQFVPRFAWASSLVCELYSKEVYAKREIRALNWGLWVVCCESDDQAPAITSPCQCSWPVDFATYLRADSDHSKRSYMLETIHEACLWIADQNSWPSQVFLVAYHKVLERGLKFNRLARKSYPTPDKRFTARIHCDYGIEWISYSAVLTRYRSKGQIATIPLGKMRPEVGRVADDVEGGRWEHGTRFVLSSARHYDWVADFSDYMD